MLKRCRPILGELIKLSDDGFLIVQDKDGSKFKMTFSNKESNKRFFEAHIGGRWSWETGYDAKNKRRILFKVSKVRVGASKLKASTRRAKALAEKAENDVKSLGEMGSGRHAINNGSAKAHLVSISKKTANKEKIEKIQEDALSRLDDIIGTINDRGDMLTSDVFAEMRKDINEIQYLLKKWKIKGLDLKIIKARNHITIAKQIRYKND